jgi:hypothetical protein
MAMRSQVYEWINHSATAMTVAGAGNSMTRRSVSGTLPQDVPADKDSDIFIGGLGNNITKPAETSATQFVVIEDLACSPHNGMHVQVRINTTDYFQNPDVTDQKGIPGLASPYPRGCPNLVSTAHAIEADGDDALLPSFTLYPDVYVLPGQTWSVLINVDETLVVDFGAATAGIDSAAIAAFVKYTLYDGPDALIANKLLELGVTVNPNNVDWYKRTLIEQQSAASAAAAAQAGA